MLMVSLLVCSSEVAGNCLQFIQIEVCNENYRLISYAVGHVVGKETSAKRKRINFIKNPRIYIAQFELGLGAFKHEDCKALNAVSIRLCA